MSQPSKQSTPTPATPNLSAFIWAIANLLCGTYKQADYGKVVLPFTVLRSRDAVLEHAKQAVLDEAENLKDSRL